MDRPGDERRDLLASVCDEWLTLGSSTEPADRPQAELGSWEAYRELGMMVPTLLIWVQSPLAGVLASTLVGFALGEPLRPRLVTPLTAVLESKDLVARRVRHDVDQTVWHGLRSAVHRQVTTDLAARGPAFERLGKDIGDYVWNRVWEEVGDQVYAQGWDERAKAADGLFEQNVQAWADSMMEGQFGAGSMAQLDALDLLGRVDPHPFAGIRRTARSCGWWWAYEAGAIFCERPRRVAMDDGALTLEFPDGWAAVATPT